jgi:hypothetical protein
VIKSQHAIAHTTSSPPDPHPDEIPGADDYLLQPIRVVPISQGHTLDRMSRINFGKIYTVESNVKVFNFGKVHEDSLHDLVHQWKQVLGLEETDQIDQTEEGD